MDTWAAAEQTVKNGGGSFNHMMGVINIAPAPVDRTAAWVVARLPYTNHHKNVSYRIPDYDRQSLYLTATFVQGVLWDFIRLHHDGGFFGTWIDEKTGTLYVDHVSFVSRSEAERIGRERGEKAIYNVVTEETVTL